MIAIIAVAAWASDYAVKKNHKILPLCVSSLGLFPFHQNMDSDVPPTNPESPDFETDSTSLPAGIVQTSGESVFPLHGGQLLI
jgi:hypothetical protein